MLAQWLKSALKTSGISGADLARQLSDRLGRSIDRAAVQKMQMVKPTKSTKPRKISADELLAISEITGVPAPDTAGAAIEVPKVSIVSAGAFADSEQVPSVDGLETIKATDLPDGDWIALEVEGDSMDRISPPGSIIFVNRKERQLVPNACYIFALEDGSATYKRYRPAPNRLEPVSSNPAHEPIFPMGRLRVVGRVRRSVLKM